MYSAGSSLLSLSPLKGRILDCAMLLEGSVIIADVGGWWVLVLSGSGGDRCLVASFRSCFANALF